MFTESINLIVITESAGSLAEAAAAGTKTAVFAEKASVRRSEFYQAIAAGMRAELMFIVRTVDYAGQQMIGWGSSYYKITRTYDRPDEMTELTCVKV